MDDDIAEDALVPAFYATMPFGERVQLGLAVTSPFGLKTSYSDEWVGRYHTIESELRTHNINPALAVKLTDWASVGMGVQFQYAEGELTRALDLGSIGGGPVRHRPGAGLQPDDDRHRLRRRHHRFLAVDRPGGVRLRCPCVPARASITRD